MSAEDLPDSDDAAADPTVGPTQVPRTRTRAARFLDAALARAGHDPHVFAVALITVAFAFLYCWYALLVLWHDDTVAGYDLAIFDQTVRSYAHLGLPRSSTLRDLDPSGTGMMQLGDHFSPILALLAPLYWIHDSPSVLLVAQGVLFAAAIPSVWLFARRALGPVAAYPAALAFALYWPLQSALQTSFHEVAFAVPLMALMLERAQAGKHRQAAVAAAVLLLVKEDMGFVVCVLGILWFREGRRRLGAVVALGGISSVVVLNFAVMPLIGGMRNRNWQYAKLGVTPGQALGNLVHHPVRFLTGFVDPVNTKLDTLVWLLLPVLFLALRSKLVLLAVPLIAERFWADIPSYWGRYWQYNAFVAVLIFVAAIDGARRLPRPHVTGLTWAMTALGTGLFVFPQEPLSSLTDPQFRQTSTASTVAANRALALVPPHQIVASSRVVEALFDRRDTVIDLEAYGGWGEYPYLPPARPQWIVSFQNDKSVEAVPGRYRLLADEDGFKVYERLG